MTVSHAAVSNSDAYRVKLSGGNQHQQIFWTERGPNEGPKPWDSELTVTDDVFWTWSQNVLGRLLNNLSFIDCNDAHHIYNSGGKLSIRCFYIHDLANKLDVFGSNMQSFTTS